MQSYLPVGTRQTGRRILRRRLGGGRLLPTVRQWHRSPEGRHCLEMHI